MTNEIQPKTSLYQLTQDYLFIKALVEEDTDFTEAFDQAEGSVIVKYENVGKVALLIKDDVKELEKHIERFQEEISRLNDRIASKNGAVSRLMFYLQEQYRQAEIRDKFQYPLFDIGIEKVKASVIIDDPSQVPASLMNIPNPPMPAPDKNRIYAHWKETGITPKGTHIVDNKHRLVIRSGRSIIASSEGYTEE